jgi:hypothetical protein
MKINYATFLTEQVDQINELSISELELINKQNQKELNKKLRLLKSESPTNVWGRLEDIKIFIQNWQNEIAHEFN